LMGKKPTSDPMEPFAKVLQQEITKVTKEMSAAAAKSSKNPENPGNPIEVSPDILEADEWVDLIVTRGSEAAPRWKSKTLKPKRNPLKAAIGAFEWYKKRLMDTLKDETFKKALGEWTLEDYGAAVEAVEPARYGDALEAKRWKITRKIGKLRPLVNALRKAILAMPETTEKEREAKMLAARRGMIVIGKVIKGVLKPEAIAEEIKKLTGAAS